MATKKSLLEPIEAEQYKTVSARIPQSLADKFDKLVERAKGHNRSLSVSKVITHAIEDACKSAGAELDALDKTASATPAQKAGDVCPKCHEGKLVEKSGQNGPFLGCSNYPECKFTAQFKKQGV